jgi:hypothetical protein
MMAAVNPPGKNRANMPRRRSRNDPRVAPTAEQLAALDLFKTEKSLRLVAFAGAGKTTTLSLLAHSTPRTGIYLTYAAAAANAAKGRFPTTVDCRTTHSLAWRVIQNARGYTMSKMRARVFPQQLSRELSLKERSVGDLITLDGRQLAYLILETIRTYCYSSDDELSNDHIEPCGKLIGVPAEARRELNEWVLLTARQVWAMMTSSTHPMPLGHDGYQKLWALSEPILTCDYLLLDEAQDTNEVVLGALRAQQCQLVCVGDPYQQIYEWRGAVNAMDRLPTDHEAALTQSFRFGEPIAVAASKVLGTLGETRRIHGNPKRHSTISHEGSARTVLARTNSGVFAEVVDALSQGLRVHVVGGVQELKDLVHDVKGLQNGRPASQPQLFGFRSWGEVMNYVQTDEGQDLRMLAGLVSQHGTANLEVATRSVVNDENEADRIVSTAHKAKGREWTDVRLLPGFAATLQRGPVAKEDIRLFYVALTRASERLVVDEAELAAFQTSTAAIVVQCVNGHRMRVPLSQLGKSGTCSRCGVKVSTSVSAAAPTTNQSESSELLMVHCPNGHRMEVPPHFKGTRGKCSRCGAAVAIPASKESHKNNAQAAPSLGPVNQAITPRNETAPGKTPHQQRRPNPVTQTSGRPAKLCPRCKRQASGTTYSNAYVCHPCGFIFN